MFIIIALSQLNIEITVNNKHLTLVILIAKKIFKSHSNKHMETRIKHDGKCV